MASAMKAVAGCFCLLPEAATAAVLAEFFSRIGGVGGAAGCCTALSGFPYREAVVVALLAVRRLR